MANRFQTPIDNQFIDTYVPIPFTELMNAASIKQDRWDQQTSNILANQSAVKSVQAIEDTPDSAYRDSVDAYVDNLADYYTSGSVDLSDALVQNQLNSDLRKIDQVRLQNIAASRANWDAERKQEADLRAKGMWNDKLYNTPWAGWDSTRGIYTGSAEAEIKTSEELQPYFEAMENEFKDIVGNDPNAFITYAYSEVGRDRIRQQSANIANELKDSTWADQQLRLKYGANYKNNISKADQQAFIETAINNYAVELWPKSNVDEFSSAGSGSGATDKPWNPADIQFRQGAQDSILTQQYDSRNANKIVRQVSDDLASIQATLDADDQAKRISPQAAMTESQREFIEGDRNMLQAQQTAAKIEADKFVGEAPKQLYDSKLSALTSIGVDKQTAETALANVIGSGITTWQDKFGAKVSGFGTAVSSTTRGLDKLLDTAVASIVNLVPAAYYNLSEDDITKKDKIAADLEKIINETSEVDVTHSATMADHISKYFESLGDYIESDVARGSKDPKVGALAILNDYRKQMKDYNAIYEDMYAKTLQSNLQYTVSGIDITLPTYEKMPNSTGYKIAETKSESRIVKWFDTLSSYKEGVIVSAVNNKGKEIKNEKVLTDLQELDWSTISDRAISTTPSFDKDGAPYLTIKFASGAGNDRKQYDIKVAYNNPAIESIKEDLLIQGTQPMLEAYISLSNTETAAKIRQSANSTTGAELTLYSAVGTPYDLNIKLNPTTGRYSLRSNYLASNGAPLYVDGLTIEEAEAEANRLTAFVLQQQ